MQATIRGWSGAVAVMVVTATLVILDIGDGSVHRYWSRHSFTSSVLSGLLVLLLTVLIVDRVARMRQLKGQSRAIGAGGGNRRSSREDGRRHREHVVVRRRSRRGI